MTHTPSTAGPHAAIAARDDRERFTLELFDRLWVRYRERVEYARTYEGLVRRHGAKFLNDHIAFRTLACQAPVVGIVSLSRLFEALGYEAAGLYSFADKHLFAQHFRHPHPEFPKLFVSELQTWRLSSPARDIVARSVAGHRAPLPLATLSDLRRIDECPGDRRAELLEEAVAWIQELPWPPPDKSDVIRLNDESQYGAWVLVHGYNVNHFTALINSHGVQALGDIDKTLDALRSAGVPLKAEIEGAPGSALRQSATSAAVSQVVVRDGDTLAGLPWTYAYFELAERGEVVDPVTGQRSRFEGFLGAQATQLFEQTRR